MTANTPRILALSLAVSLALGACSRDPAPSADGTTAAPAATAPAAPALEAPAALPSAATDLTPLPAPAPLPATVQPLAAQPPAQRPAPVLRRRQGDNIPAQWTCSS